MANYSFECAYRINSHDCDYNNHLRPSGLLKYLQESANLHIETMGQGYDVLKEKGQAFILSRLAVTLYEPIYAYDRVISHTTPNESKGASFIRTTTLEKSGRVVASLSSLWALVNIETKALIRVNDANLDLPIGKDCPHPAPLRFRIPGEVHLEPLGEIRADYSVCDRNRHMNNTTYADALCNLLPDLEGMRIAELSLCYQTEMPLGESAAVLHGIDAQGVHYFKTTRASDGKSGVEARMRFVPLP